MPTKTSAERAADERAERMRVTVSAGRNYPFDLTEGVVYDEDTGDRHETVHVQWRRLPSGWTPALGMHFTRAEVRAIIGYARRRWGADV